MKILKKGFTLIELIIVMAILGILAAGLIAALDPAEQINRANDTRAVDGMQDISNAQERYWTNTQTYTTALLTLQNAGELKTSYVLPAGVTIFRGASALTKPWICYSVASKAKYSASTTVAAATTNHMYATAASPTADPIACTAAQVGTLNCRQYCIQ